MNVKYVNYTFYRSISFYRRYISKNNKPTRSR